MTESQTHGIREGGACAPLRRLDNNRGQKRSVDAVEDASRDYEGIADRVKKRARFEGKEVRMWLSQGTRDVIALRQSYCCNICQQLLPLGKQVDHVLALRHGGSNELNNYQFLCANCHTRKTIDDMDPDGYEHRTGKSKYLFPGPLFRRLPSRPPRRSYDPDAT